MGDFSNQELRNELENEVRKSGIKDDPELIRLKQRYLNDGQETASTIEAEREEPRRN
jgi:hypothetical protein